MENEDEIAPWRWYMGLEYTSPIYTTGEDTKVPRKDSSHIIHMHRYVHSSMWTPQTIVWLGVSMKIEPTNVYFTLLFATPVIFSEPVKAIFGGQT